MKSSVRCVAALALCLAAAWSVPAIAQDNGARTVVPAEGQVPGKPEFTPRGTAILAEDFDDITTLMGDDWVMTNESVPLGTTDWFQGNDAVFPSQAGAADAYIGANFNNTSGVGTIDNWLITPVLPLNQLSEFSFWARSPDGSTFPDRIQVLMNVTNTGSATSDFTVVLADLDPVSTSGWAQTVINSFPGATAQGRIAFRYFVTDGGPSGSNSDYIGIDSLEVLAGADSALTLGDVSTTEACASDPGNVNGIIEPGETVTFGVPINADNGAFTNVVGTMTSTTPGVSILTGMGMHGDIADGGSSSADYSILVDPGASCFTTIDLTLSVTSDQGNFSFPLTRDIGQAGSFTYNGLPLAITDNLPAGVSSTADVAGVPGPITSVQVQVTADHTWVGDLIFTLTSPGGTSVTLMDRPGVPGLSPFGCSNNNVDVLFGDGLPDDPEGTCSGAGQGNTADPWPVSNATPVQPLSALNGEDANGTWTLTVSDNAGGDTGTLLDWELLIEPAAGGTCDVCEASGGPFGPAVAVPTMNALGLMALLLSLIAGGYMALSRRRTVR